MGIFKPQIYGAVIAELLAEARVMPLDAGTANSTVTDRLSVMKAEDLFADGTVTNDDMAEACLSGLWLYHDDIFRSHSLSQGIGTREGSYWHGIMHRRENDFWNANYWFHRVPTHPIHEILGENAKTIAAEMGSGAFENGPWDPFAFVDLCERAVSGDKSLSDLCRAVQMREWELLFDYCYARVVT